MDVATSQKACNLSKDDGGTVGGMRQIQFVAYCTPQPQGSIKGFVLPGKNGKGPRAILTTDNKRLKPFRSELTRCAMVAMGEQGITEPFAEKHVPVQLAITLIFNKPKSVSKKRSKMVVKPDIDKLLRSCLDSLTGIIYADDAQVVDVRIKKDYGPVEGAGVLATILEES